MKSMLPAGPSSPSTLMMPTVRTTSAVVQSRGPPVAYLIKVNGSEHAVAVDGDTPLLWVLRDVLGMTGTKFGGGMALCGACTVHVDGVATRSCITTIEAIGDTPVGKRIQRAWLDLEASSAAIASPARSCRPLPCSRTIPIRAMPTSTGRCQATSAAAGPTYASMKPSDEPHAPTPPDGRAEHAPRPHGFPGHGAGSGRLRSPRRLTTQPLARERRSGRRPPAQHRPAFARTTPRPLPRRTIAHRTRSSASAGMGS